MIRHLILLVLVALPSLADEVVPTRTIRAHTIIEASDVVLRRNGQAGGYDATADVIGQEARAVLYPGRPIRAEDIGPPALVARNEVVRIAFRSNGLQITAEGRALERGALGDRVRVMNLASRSTVIGQVQPDGSIRVTP